MATALGRRAKPARAMLAVVDALSDHRFEAVALSGGVVQNRFRFERVSARLREAGSQRARPSPGAGQ